MANVRSADESSYAIMAKLRRIGADSPAESLALSRYGNEYFPDGPDAPERDWIIVKALVSLRPDGPPNRRRRRGDQKMKNPENWKRSFFASLPSP